jgi:hypothetical protein
MASNISGMLTQKIGPFPGYVWALVVGGAVYWFGIRGKAAGTSSSGIVGTMPGGLPGPAGPAGATGATGLQGLMGAIGLTGATGATGATGPAGTTPPGGSSASTNPDTTTGTVYRDASGNVTSIQPPLPPSYWTNQGFAAPQWAIDNWNAWIAGGGKGVGGGRSASIGSRSADPHSYFHPLMKAIPRYAHFAQGGVGGAPVAHAAAVHEVAHAAGIHPARLAALNARPHKYIRVA